MEVRPVDLPVFREEAVAHMRAHGAYLYRMENGSSSVDNLVNAEISRLNSADLFYVAKEMVHLAQVAAQSLPGVELAPDCLPSTHGFVMFSEVIVGFVPYRAASWGVMNLVTDEEDIWGVWVSWYSSPNDVEGQGASLGRLIRIGQTFIPFGAMHDDSDAADGPSDTPAVLALASVWILMGQTIASTESVSFDRASVRRTLRKVGRIPLVRVIQLRRRSSQDSDPESDREYHHQWIVRGHWRKQWYPSVNDHRPVWIAPHIKGPEGAPLLGGERVYSLKR